MTWCTPGSSTLNPPYCSRSILSSSEGIPQEIRPPVRNDACPYGTSIVRGDCRLKVSIVSFGTLILCPLVRTCTPVPTPAPVPAPIAAPFPPPTMAPMTAPTAAAPPMVAADRLALDGPVSE